MDFDKSSIKYLVGLLFIISIGYIFYLMYKDILYVRNEILKIQNNIDELTEKINFKYDNDIQEDNQDYDDDEQDEDEYEDDEQDDDEQDDDDENCSYEHHHRNKWDSNSNIFDQFMINSEQLQNLQQIQKEIEGNTITELDDENIQVLKNENIVNSIEVVENKTQNDEESIKFLSEKQKCESILKSGKNKGNNCGRDTYNGTLYCKLHQS